MTTTIASKHQIEENDDPSPLDLTQWISTLTSLQPNFEFSYPNTWKLDCMASGTLKLISPTEISPWFNQEDADDSVMDQIRVDFTQKTSAHEEIHTETFKKLMSSYAISDYCEIEVLKDSVVNTNLNAKKSLVQYTSYGRIQMTRHYIVTVSLQSCTYIFTYLTESLSGDKNLLVFLKFLNNFKFPESGSTFVYELQMNENSILFDIPFPYQVVQKRECSLTVYTPSHAKFSSTENSSQLYFDFQVFKTNSTIETVANEALNRAGGDFDQTSAQNYTFNVLQAVTQTELVPESYTFSYEYQHNEDKQDRRFVEKYFTPLSTGDLLVSTLVNSSIPSDIQSEELQVFRKVLQSFKLVSRSERREHSAKIINSNSSQTLGQQLSEFNITVYGESGVGKSTLIHQYLSGTEVSELPHNKKEHSYRKYVSKSDSHSAFVLNILDTCGNYELESGCQFEKVIRADAVLLICSPDQQSSIDRIETFINRIERLKKRKLSEIPSLIVFNKSDIEENVLVKSEDAKKLADQYGITFIECTSKKQSKVNDLFDGALIAELYSKQYILNSMQSDQKKLSEDIENFQYLITQNQVDQISTLISESAFPPALASEYLNLPIIFYAVDTGVEESTLRLLIDYNNKFEKYNLKTFTTKDINALNLAAFAATKGNLAAIKVLEEYGITLDQTNTDTNILAHILNNSSENGNDMVQYILQKYDSFLSRYVNVSFKDEENGVTYPIHTATKSGSTFSVKWLLSHEGSQTVNEKDNLGLTPLLLAAAEGNIPLVQILLDSGAKLTNSDDTLKDFLKENCPEDKLTEVLSLLQ